MSHSGFEDRAKNAFDNLEDQDIAKSLQAKERIWKTLNVERKKPRTYQGLIWFLLGLMLALGAIFLKDKFFDRSSNQEVPIVQNESEMDWLIEINKIKSTMTDLETKYKTKSDQFDSLNHENLKMLGQIQNLITQQHNKNFATTQIKYVTDTIYATKIEKEIVERQVVLKDTIFIEVPIVQNDEELMTDISSDPNLSIDKPKKSKDKSSKRNKPTSVQFNFNNSIHNK